MILTNVDFPAPFSPTSACTSPRRSSTPTPSSAVTPAKRLVMPSILRTTSVIAPLCPVVRRGGGSRSALRADSVRLRDELLRVGLVEEAVGEDDLLLERLPLAELL